MVEVIFFHDRLLLTKEMVASYFDVDERTIECYLSANIDEFKENGYQILRGKELKEFLKCYDVHSGSDIYVATRTTVLGVSNFRAFSNMAMLLSESKKARTLRQLMLEIVINLINRKTGGGTKYINQRNKDFLFYSLNECNC